MASDKPIISLFSGAMGLDIGLEAAGSGIRTAVAVEINKYAVETIRQNRPDIPVFDKSIEDVTTAEILQAAGLKKGEAFAVIGGPCCQSFSTAGKRESLSDKKRGGLFRHFTRIVREARPRFFVMENVKGILSAAVQHRPLNNRGPGCPPLSSNEEFGSALKVICKELAALNYQITFGLLNCADYGVPQKRYRVVFIGSRDGEPIHLPFPTHSESGAVKWRTLKDAIGDLNERNPETLGFSAASLALLKKLKAGQNWTSLPVYLQKKALGKAFDSWGGRVGFCRRLAWDVPSPTLTTAPNGRATALCHPTKLRPLSIKEYARIQQFSDEWVFCGSTAQKYTQIGNAVPIGLGKAIGAMLLHVFQRTARQKVSTKKYVSGKVVCGDPALEQRLKNRPRTKLNPPRMRTIKDAAAAQEWMRSRAAA